MPLIAPDRNKGGGIASAIVAKLNPSFAGAMRESSVKNIESMNRAEADHESYEELEENGALALRAMFSAMQSGDFKAAWKAYSSAHVLCDQIVEGENTPF